MVAILEKDLEVNLILVVVALILGFMIGLFIKVEYTYEIYDDVMQTIENIVIEEVKEVD